MDLRYLDWSQEERNEPKIECKLLEYTTVREDQEMEKITEGKGLE